ncbi:unnamed protein product, partial [marine sediment metagenome]
MAALTWKTTPSGKRYPYAVQRENGKKVWYSLSKFAGQRITTIKDA